jgi:hypothetical protein
LRKKDFFRAHLKESGSGLSRIYFIPAHATMRGGAQRFRGFQGGDFFLIFTKFSPILIS